MTNGEYITNVAHSLAFVNAFPIYLEVSGIQLELQDVDYELDSNHMILARVVVKDDSSAIADVCVNGALVSLEDDYVDWLNDEMEVVHANV